LAICGSLFAVQEKQAPRQSEYTCMVEKRPVFCWIFGCQMPEEGRGKREEGCSCFYLVFLLKSAFTRINYLDAHAFIFGVSHLV
jgi:hypothetical protein